MQFERVRATAASSIWIRAALVALCAVVPVLSLYYVWAENLSGEIVPSDFGYYYRTAEALLNGHSIYGGEEFVVSRGFIVDYVYPPVTAMVVAPFTALSIDAGAVAFCIFLILVFCVALASVGVRDWRCYGLAFAWPPVLEGVATGNITFLMVLAAALTWRYRDSARAAGASLGLGLALKLVLWPVVMWLAATRRVKAGVWAVGLCAGVVLLSWAVIGFDGFLDYPRLLRRLTRLTERDGYSAYALGLDAGLPSEAARLLWFTVAVCLLSAVVVLGRRRSDRASFAVALAAVVACTPIVWLHYLSFVVLAMAVAQPTLGAAWFIGLPMQVVVTTGEHNGSPFQTVSVLALSAFALALAVRSTAAEPAPRAATTRPVAESR